MSIFEAQVDGIRTEIINGNTFYFPKCHICEKEIKCISYKSGLTYTCKECKFLESLERKKNRQIANIDKKEQKFANAVRRLSSQGIHMDRYSAAIEKIHEKLHKEGWFDSTEEIMVAIELVQKHIHARHQVSFGRYRADFVLPTERVVLEIDGAPFHNENTREKEKLRDGLINLALGPEWEIIRIPCDRINENLSRLLPAITAVKKKRKMLKDENGGLLPQWY